MRKSVGYLALVVVAATAIVGCGSDSKASTASSGGAKALKVDAYDFRFEPTSLTVEAGQAVKVSVHNEGNAEHNFSLDEAKVNLDVDEGQAKDATFTAPSKPGDYTYFCEYHRDRGMKGTIHVTGGSGTTASSDTSGGSGASGY
jgi:plastocyanin